MPVLASDSASHDIIGMVFCKLLRYSKELTITTDLATRYEVLDGGLRLRFYLHPEARWHDGHPVDAADVVFTLDTIRDPETPTPYRSNYARIASYEAIDARTVEIRYDKPFSPALESFTSLYLLPEHLLKGKDLLTSPLNREPVGCGPYRFVRWDEKREIELVANEDWYRGRARIDHYLYRIIPDQATMFLELQNHGIDQMGLTPQQYTYQTEKARFTDDFDKYTYTGFNYTYLGYNFERPRFADLKVRRALGHAVDKQELIDGVLLGLGEQATGPFRPGMWYYNPEVSSPSHDPAKAKELLAEAGWTDSDGDGIRDKDGEPFTFTIITNQGNLQRKQVGEILQQRFRDVGVKTELRVLEWATFLNDFVDTGNFDAVILGWNTGIDPDQYDIWHSSKTGNKEFNFIHYDNPEVDALLERARSTFDRDERRQAYFRIQEILAWEQPYLFMYVPKSLPVVQNRVRGIEPAPAGIGYNFEQWWIPADRQGFHQNP